MLTVPIVTTEDAEVTFPIFNSSLNNDCLLDSEFPFECPEGSCKTCYFNSDVMQELNVSNK